MVNFHGVPRECRRYEVELSFQPKSLRAGVWLSVFGFGLVLLAFHVPLYPGTMRAEPRRMM